MREESLSSIRKEFFHIRKCLHEYIYEYITKFDFNGYVNYIGEFAGEETQNLEIINRPYERKKKPNPKLIVFVEDEKTAKEIKDTCTKEIESTNKSLREVALKYNEPLYNEIKYNIKIISSESDLILTTRTATSRKRMMGKEVKRKIREALDLRKAYVKTNDSQELRNYDVLQLFSDNKNYTMASITGTSYRITYFENGCRHQTSVGDILIVVNKKIRSLSIYHEKIEMKKSEPRKQRADKKQLLFSLEFTKNEQESIVKAMLKEYLASLEFEDDINPAKIKADTITVDVYP